MTEVFEDATAIERADPLPAPAPIATAPERFDMLTGNVKGQRMVYQLEPCTAWVGGNEAGKSAALDAVQLALTGRVPAGLAEVIGTAETDLEAALQAPNGSFSLAIPRAQIRSNVDLHGPLFFLRDNRTARACSKNEGCGHRCSVSFGAIADHPAWA